MITNNKVDLEKLLKTKKISQRTYDKVIIAKQIIEKKYNFQGIKYTEWNNIIEKINNLEISNDQKDLIKKQIFNQEVTKYRKKREKQTVHEYESLSIIGRGAFGEVHVCKEKKTGNIVAVKKIRKDVLIIKNQVIHVRNEQLLMSKVKSPWIVELKASFQEDDYLYLVMEYLPGGDFMNLLIKKDILSEEDSKFYTAELILAIESIHKLDCIHRDIKPDNILIAKNGHIKLTDFGLAKVSDKIFEKNIDEEFLLNKHQKNFSCVGTAYYVAPEVLNKKGYGPEIDWWSVGVIFFEMLVGYAPFCSKETSEVCYKVLNWKKFLKIPNKIKMSKEAKDLISKLINNSNVRLGLNGAEEIKCHPFFKDVDWENIRNTKAPFIPDIKNDYDTSYFETYEKKEPFYPTMKRFNKRKDVEYIGYTYKDDPYNDLTLINEFQNSMKMVDEMFNNKKNGGDNNDKIANGKTEKSDDGDNYEKLKKDISLSINCEVSNCYKVKNQNKINRNYTSYNKNNYNNKRNYNINQKPYINKNNLSEKEKNIYLTEKENKIIKTEPNINNSTQKNENDTRCGINYKLNVIQLPSKKIKEPLSKKITVPANGASPNPKNYMNITYSTGKNNTNNNNTHMRLSPQAKNVFFKKFALFKSNSKNKKNDGNGYNMSVKGTKSNDKIILNKAGLKLSISQNAVKKKYVGFNSSKCVFIGNNNMNLANNKLSCSGNSDRKPTLPQTSKINYIYQKKQK